MQNLTSISLILIIFLCGCEENKKIEEFLKPAPVQPLVDVIRASVPLGYCASVAMAGQLGYPVPGDRINLENGVSLTWMIPSGGFPLTYLDKACSEIYILDFKIDEEFSIISTIFITEHKEDHKREILEFHSIPVIREEGKLMLVFAGQDIMIRDSVEINISMGPAEIWIEMERLEKPRPESTEAAIRQNAWVIDVDPGGTWMDYSDDTYLITGGSQDVSTLHGNTFSEAEIVQMAMMDARIGPDCLLAPTNGYGIIREVSVSTGPHESLEDLVLGTVFYEFNSVCTGQVSILLATGNFITGTGKKVDLELLYP